MLSVIHVGGYPPAHAHHNRRPAAGQESVRTARLPRVGFGIDCITIAVRGMRAASF